MVEHQRTQMLQPGFGRCFEELDALARACTPLVAGRLGYQVKLLDKLLGDFEGKLTSSKWAAIAKCSPDTALRDINDLVVRGVLRKTDGGGRSTGYVLSELPL